MPFIIFNLIIEWILLPMKVNAMIYLKK